LQDKQHTSRLDVAFDMIKQTKLPEANASNKNQKIRIKRATRNTMKQQQKHYELHSAFQL
jgi:hypothetical protein